MPIKQTIKANLKNILWGKRVPQKMVIFESDDWGSNWIGSNHNYELLIKNGIFTKRSDAYNKSGNIAKKDDLQLLFEVLSSVKDYNGNHAKFTNFFTPVNPNFDKIKADNFQNYYYETFLETLAKTGEDKDVSLLWKQGIDGGLIVPAYHAREHLCVPLWMQYLQDNDEKVKEAFKYQFYSVHHDSLPPAVRAFRPALFFNTDDQKKYIGESLQDGLNIMNQLFGIRPKIFAPPNGISHPYFDEVLSKLGILSIIAHPKRIEPNGNGAFTSRSFSNPDTNRIGQKFYYRNVWFEPYQRKKNALDFTMRQIKAAFYWNKAAIICTHRVSYVKGNDPQNRERGLFELRTLLKEIVKKWPDVIFASSEDYSKILHNEK